MEEKSKIKKMIIKSIIIFCIVLAMAVIAIIILKYHVEGEQNMPFDLSEILVVSTAEGYQNDSTASDKNWDVEVYQTNDVYLNIKKNKNYKDTEIIKQIKISNISIEDKPLVGDINIYLPTDAEQTYNYSDDSKINSEITYTSDTDSDIKNLKISNQGGTIIFRVVNKTGKRYTSDEEELKHDGTLLQKVELSNNDVKTKISFDLTIELESEISFTGKVTLELPIDDVDIQGITNLDKKDMSDIVFKRQ